MRDDGGAAGCGGDAAYLGPFGRGWAWVVAQVRWSLALGLFRACVMLTRVWPFSILLRFMSTPTGFRFLYAADYIDREMDLWFHVG